MAETDITPVSAPESKSARRYICWDCRKEFPGYQVIVGHVRTIHNREPRCGPTLKVGDIVVKNGLDYKVTKLLPDGTGFAVPQLRIVMEYRADKSAWEIAE